MHRKREKDEPESNFNRPVDNLLWHEGKVRSVDDGSFELADMLYSVNVLPLGGFVRLAGESNPTVPLSLAARPPWQRIIVMAAGSAMNAILPLLIFAVMFMLPQEVETGRLTVTGVLEGGAAANAGVLPGDVLLEANGRPIERRLDLTREVNLNGGSEMTILLERNGRTEEVSLRPRFDAEGSRWLVGVAVDLADMRVETRSRSLWASVPESFTATRDLLLLLKQSVSGMISEGAAPDLAGPVGIAQMTGEITRDGGLAGWLSVGILLSINLAIINILPFPMLDGGRIVFVVIEWVRRGKRIPPEKEGLVHLVGLAVLIAGIIAITANDIMRLMELAA